MIPDDLQDGTVRFSLVELFHRASRIPQARRAVVRKTRCVVSSQLAWLCTRRSTISRPTATRSSEGDTVLRRRESSPSRGVSGAEGTSDRSRFHPGRDCRRQRHRYTPYRSSPHLRLHFRGYVITSYGMIIQKPYRRGATNLDVADRVHRPSGPLPDRRPLRATSGRRRRLARISPGGRQEPRSAKPSTAEYGSETHRRHWPFRKGLRATMVTMVAEKASIVYDKPKEVTTWTLQQELQMNFLLIRGRSIKPITGRCARREVSSIVVSSFF